MSATDIGKESEPASSRPTGELARLIRRFEPLAFDGQNSQRLLVLDKRFTLNGISGLPVAEFEELVFLIGNLAVNVRDFTAAESVGSSGREGDRLYAIRDSLKNARAIYEGLTPENDVAQTIDSRVKSSAQPASGTKFNVNSRTLCNAGRIDQDFARTILARSVGRTIRKILLAPDFAVDTQCHTGEYVIFYFSDGSSLELQNGSNANDLSEVYRDQSGMPLFASDVKLSFDVSFDDGE